MVKYMPIEKLKAKQMKPPLRDSIQTKVGTRFYDALINILKVLTNEIGEICAGMRAQNTEEIIGGDDLATALRKIILNECKESFVANAGAKVFEKMRAAEIRCISVGAKPLTIVNGNICQTLRVVNINAIHPPPGNEIGTGVFVVDAF